MAVTNLTLYNCSNGNVIKLDLPDYTPESSSYNSVGIAWDPSSVVLPPLTTGNGNITNNNAYAGIDNIPNFATYILIVFPLDPAVYTWPYGYCFMGAPVPQVNVQANTITFNLTISQYGNQQPNTPPYCCTGLVEIDNLGLNYSQDVTIVINTSSNFSPAPAATNGSVIIMHPQGHPGG